MRSRLLLGAILLTGLALRAVRLNFQPLWWDEGYSVFFATRDFGTMLARTAVDIHPPLYYAFLQGWIALAGKNDVALRTMSVFIGVVSIPLIYLLARHLFNARTGMLAALLLAISPLAVYYSQEVRMYGLVTLLGMASVYCLARLLSLPTGDRKRTGFAAGYILLTAAALYTEYYAAFLLIFEIIAIVIQRFRISKPTLESEISPLKWFGAVALLYLPWVSYAGWQLYSYVTAKVTHEAYASLDPLTYLAQHFAAFSAGHPTLWTWLSAAGVLFLALAGFGIAAARRSRLDSLVLVLLYLLVPLTLGYAVNIVYPFHPVHYERLLLLAAPAFYILVALGIEALYQRRALVALPALLIVAAISGASLYDFYSVPRYPKDDYRPLFAEMQKSAQPGDVFLAVYPWQIGYLETYYKGAPVNVVEAPSDLWINNPSRMQTDVDVLRSERSRIWVPALQTLGRILEDALDAYLRPRDYGVVDAWFGTTRLELFAAAQDPTPAQGAVSFGNGLRLAAWGISTGPVAAGQDLVRLKLDWGETVPSGWNITSRLLDAQGNLWAQDDRDLSSGTQRIGFAVPPGTPPGTYDLRLALYRATAPGQAYAAPGPLAQVLVRSPAEPRLDAIPQRQAGDLNEIRLVGYEASPPFRPGEPTAITFYWQAARQPTTDYVIRYELRDHSGNSFGSVDARPAFGIYPTSQWKPGELVRDPETLMIAGNTPDGVYHLTLSLLLADGKPSASLRVIGDVTVKGRPHYFGMPSVQVPFNARFGNVARLVGYDLHPGAQSIHLVLYWQALATPGISYKVFAHALDANGAVIGQRDQIPGDGAYPTTSWVQGEYLVDEYDVPLPSAVAATTALEVGAYDPATGARLPVFDAANQPAGDRSRLPMRIN